MQKNERKCEHVQYMQLKKSETRHAKPRVTNTKLRLPIGRLGSNVQFYFEINQIEKQYFFFYCSEHVVRVRVWYCTPAARE